MESFQCFLIDGGKEDSLVFKLANSPMKDWHHLLAPPFDQFILEYKTEILGPEVIENNRSLHKCRPGWIHIDKMSLCIRELPKDKVKRLGTNVTFSPLCFFWSEPEGIEQLEKEADDYFRNLPTNDLATLGMGGATIRSLKDFRDYHMGASDYPEYPKLMPILEVLQDNDLMVMHQPGSARVYLAYLALMNVERETIVLPKSYRAGRVFVNGDSKPSYEPLVVRIQPNAARIILEEDGSIQEGHREVRQHEVRRHLRRLKSGREVWVKPHKRGNPELGTIIKTYQIESDPLAQDRADAARKLLH